MSKKKKTKIKRFYMNHIEVQPQQSVKPARNRAGLINLIGIIILSLALLAAVIIMVTYFSIRVDVTNTLSTSHEQQNSSTIIPVEDINESTEDNNPDGDDSEEAENVPTEEATPGPTPSEETEEISPSEGEGQEVEPREETKPEVPEESPIVENPITSTLKIKIKVDHIGKVWTRWVMINQTEGTAISYDEIIAHVQTDLEKEFGYIQITHAVGNCPDYTYTVEDAIYDTVIWIIG